MWAYIGERRFMLTKADGSNVDYPALDSISIIVNCGHKYKREYIVAKSNYSGFNILEQKFIHYDGDCYQLVAEDGRFHIGTTEYSVKLAYDNPNCSVDIGNGICVDRLNEPRFAKLSGHIYTCRKLEDQSGKVVAIILMFFLLLLLLSLAQKA
jgi:hypothetical protein